MPASDLEPTFAAGRKSRILDFPKHMIVMDSQRRGAATVDIPQSAAGHGKSAIVRSLISMKLAMAVPPFLWSHSRNMLIAAIPRRSEMEAVVWCLLSLSVGI